MSPVTQLMKKLSPGIQVSFITVSHKLCSTGEPLPRWVTAFTSPVGCKVLQLDTDNSLQIEVLL